MPVTKPLGLLVVMWTLLWGSVSPVQAQFSTPLQISAAGNYSNLGVARDIANNILFVYDDGSDIYFSSAFLGGGTQINITNTAQTNGHARIATGGLGTSYVVYEQDGLQPSSVGRDILLVNNLGGPFANPINVTFSAADDRHPEIAFSPSGQFISVYEENVPGGEQIFTSANGGVSALIAAGKSPALAITSDGALNIAYERGGDYFYTRRLAGVNDPEAPLSALAGDDSDLEMVRDTNNVLHCVFVNAGTIYYVNNELGTFGTPEPISSAPIDSLPRLTARGAGDVAVTWTESGNIVLRERTAGSFQAPSSVTNSGNTFGPVPTYDSLGFLHIGFIQGGVVVYLNNVPAPVADFSANETSGEINLSVQFTNNSSGIFSQRLWDFGDGSTSFLNNPSHTYTTAGPKTVSLTVIGPGGTVTETKTDFIVCLPPTHILYMASISAFPGHQVRHPVRATHPGALQGFQLAVLYDDSITPVSDVTFANSATLALNPDFVFFSLNPNGDDSSFVMAIIFENSPPFDGTTLVAGVGQILANVDYTIPPSTPLGTSSNFTFAVDGIGEPQIGNIFTTDQGLSVQPYIIDAVVSVDTPIGATTFLRGDNNGDGLLSLIDAIFVLNFLFIGGSAPSCLDSADFADTGQVGIPDVIGLLNFLFLQGTPPSYPFPFPGLDPTPDTLPCP